MQPGCIQRRLPYKGPRCDLGGAGADCLGRATGAGGAGVFGRALGGDGTGGFDRALGGDDDGCGGRDFGSVGVFAVANSTSDIPVVSLQTWRSFTICSKSALGISASS
jgi:hypothetical protein